MTDHGGLRTAVRRALEGEDEPEAATGPESRQPEEPDAIARLRTFAEEEARLRAQDREDEAAQAALAEDVLYGRAAPDDLLPVTRRRDETRVRRANVAALRAHLEPLARAQTRRREIRAFYDQVDQQAAAFAAVVAEEGPRIDALIAELAATTQRVRAGLAWRALRKAFYQFVGPERTDSISTAFDRLDNLDDALLDRLRLAGALRDGPVSGQSSARDESFTEWLRWTQNLIAAIRRGGPRGDAGHEDA